MAFGRGIGACGAVWAFAWGACGLAGCAHHTAEEEPTPQIRVVPGAASRSLWIGHGGARDGGEEGGGEDGNGNGKKDAGAL